MGVAACRDDALGDPEEVSHVARQRMLAQPCDDALVMAVGELHLPSAHPRPRGRLCDLKVAARGGKEFRVSIWSKSRRPKRTPAGGAASDPPAGLRSFPIRKARELSVVGHLRSLRAIRPFDLPPR